MTGIGVCFLTYSVCVNTDCYGKENNAASKEKAPRNKARKKRTKKGEQRKCKLQMRLTVETGIIFERVI